MNKFFYPIICFYLYFFPTSALAQLNEDFSDGNFNENPIWIGNDSLFKVNANFELQASATASLAAESYLSTFYTKPKEIEWRYYVRFGFNPSTQNFVRIYLNANHSNPKLSTQSYFLQLGGSTGSTDSLVLYKEINQVKTSLVRGRPGTLGKTLNSLMLRVRRSETGIWSLEMDTSNTGHYVTEGIANDTNSLQGNYTGIYFKFTSSNYQNLFFDNVYIGPNYTDTIAPQLLESSIENDSTLLLNFDEKIEVPLLNQIVLNQNTIAGSLQQQGNSLRVFFSKQFPSDQSLEFTLIKIQDANGNRLDTSFQLHYHALQKGDILISEIFPDPEPSNGLPAAEFLEIYNNYGEDLKVKSLSISDGSGNYKLPQFTLHAHEFKILCASKDSALFQKFGNVVPANYFPSLNNLGDNIQLLDAQQSIIDSIQYSLEWYQDLQKANGGYTLELNNPKQTCKGKDNWTASTANIGGTPGTANSNWQIFYDTLAPKIISLSTVNNHCIKITLDEKPATNQLLKDAFSLENISCSNVKQTPQNEKELLLFFTDSLEHLKQYVLKMDGLQDCSGNSLFQQFSFTHFAIKTANQNDILIHEIYFNLNKKGKIPNVAFIELYNRSDYSISLEKMKLSDANSQSILPPYILQAKHYLIICKETAIDSFTKYGEVLGLSHFPSLNYSDALQLQDSIGYPVHQVNYQQNWFEPNAYLYACTLELIDPANPCGLAENWKASTSKNGGTPGQANSVAGTNKDQKAPTFMRAYLPNSSHIELHFNEAIDSSSLGPFRLNDTLLHAGFQFINKALTAVQISLPFALDSNETYQLYIDNLNDCAQNHAANTGSLPFQLPIEPTKENLVINEVLFNPVSGDNDFIELYNTSSRTLDLRNLVLFTLDENGNRKDIAPFAEDGWMIYPNEYLCIAPDAKILQQQHFGSNLNAIIPHAIPALNDDEGILVLKNKNENTLDSFYFSDKMHLSFMNQTEGISLERINPFMPSTEKSNWTSAAEDYGFSSPTQKNSVFRATASNSNFSLSMPYFSPDGDGENDVMQFFYSCEKTGNVGKLEIYQQNGNCVKKICAAKVLGNKGEINWTGDTDDGKKAPIGLYIANWTLFNENGNSETILKTFALLGK